MGFPKRDRADFNVRLSTFDFSAHDTTIDGVGGISISRSLLDLPFFYSLLCLQYSFFFYFLFDFSVPTQQTRLWVARYRQPPPTLPHLSKHPPLSIPPISQSRTHSTSIKMTGRGGGGRQRISIAPINYIFESLKTKQTLAVSLVEQKHITIEGILEVLTPIFD